jgi:hypothetical protein
VGPSPAFPSFSEGNKGTAVVVTELAAEVAEAAEAVPSVSVFDRVFLSSQIAPSGSRRLPVPEQGRQQGAARFTFREATK